MSSSFLMNSSPAAYPTGTVDPKFPPNEEYSQSNYIPDYYGTNVQSLANQSHHHLSHHNPHHHPHPYGYHLNYIDQTPVQPHPYGHSMHPAHHGHHPSMAPSALAAQAPTLGQQHQYFSPCSISPMAPNNGGMGHGSSSLHHPLHNSVSNSISPHHQSPLGANPMQHLSSRVSSPMIPHDTPSPQPQLGIAEPPSPLDCGMSTASGSDSGAGNGNSHPVIYPWMKKVHVNQGKGNFRPSLPCPSALEPRLATDPISWFRFSWSFLCCRRNSEWDPEQQWQHRQQQLQQHGSQTPKNGVHQASDTGTGEGVPFQSLLDSSQKNRNCTFLMFE